MTSPAPGMNWSKTGVLWDRYGPRLEIENRGTSVDRDYRFCINIRDLNPPLETNWCFSRWDVFKIGFWFIWHGLTARHTTKEDQR